VQIFLDIDGVMVPASSWKMPEIHSDGFPVFSSQAVRALTRILKETSAKLVLTTSHKGGYSPTQWKNMFASRGISVPKVQTLPKNVAGLSRKEELLNWLSSIKDPNFIIIDDDKSLNDLPSFHKERLVLTNGMIGLTDTLADEAIALLKGNTKGVSV
jgi:hypothetical protein